MQIVHKSDYSTFIRVKEEQKHNDTDLQMGPIHLSPKNSSFLPILLLSQQIGDYQKSVQVVILDLISNTNVYCTILSILAVHQHLTGVKTIGVECRRGAKAP